jgi:hypothetical protein
MPQETPQAVIRLQENLALTVQCMRGRQVQPYACLRGCIVFMQTKLRLALQPKPLGTGENAVTQLPRLQIRASSRCFRTAKSLIDAVGTLLAIDEDEQFNPQHSTLFGGRHMQLVKSSQSLSTLLAAAALAVSVSAQQPVTQIAQSQSVSAVTVPAGQKQKLSGVILEREADSLLVRDYKGTTYQVSVSGSTKIKERKSNPFRGANRRARQ